MSRRVRALLIVAASLGLLIAALISAGALVLRSHWFAEKVRQRIIAEVERSTGGRAELGSFEMKWRRLRVEVRNFVLHGTEPAGRPPLFRADLIAIGLKIVSVLKKDVDIQYLDVTHPQAYLIIYPDGRTNVPEPKIRKPRDRTTVETILDVAIGRFDLQDGSFEVEGRGKTPFDARGRNARARFNYAIAGPRYAGTVSVAPLDVVWGGYRPFAADVNAALSVEKNRVQVSSATVQSGRSRVEMAGSVEDLATKPRAAFDYKARAAMDELGRILKLTGRQEGEVQLAGKATAGPGGAYSVTGDLHAAGVDYAAGKMRLRNIMASGKVDVTPERIHVSGLEASGSLAAPRSIRFGARVASTSIHGDEIDARGVRAAALGGSFAGNVSIRGFDRFRVDGAVSGLEARRLVALEGRPEPPWDGRLSGPVRLEGSLKRPADLRAQATIKVAPAETGAPVSGSIEVAYNGRAGTIDLGRSFLALPHTRADIAGTLGRELRVHFESHDLSDLQPVIGRELPVKLAGGTAIFDGTVDGPLNGPQIAGRASLTRFTYEGREFDTVSAAIRASGEALEVGSGTLARGTLRAQFTGSLGLRDWKPEDSSPLTLAASLQNGNIADLLTLAGEARLQAAGTLAATATVHGTLGAPVIEARAQAVKGNIAGEPFDRVSAIVKYGAGDAQLLEGQWVAGTKRMDATAQLSGVPGRFPEGKVAFDVASNVLPINEIQLVARERPEARGSLQVRARGAGRIAKTPGGKLEFRLEALNGELAARGLQAGEQRFGDIHLTATSEGSVLRARLQSDFAGSAIQGSGEWRLTDDYPGTAHLSFSKVDPARVLDWVSPATAPRRLTFSGSIQGDVEATGPALKPGQWTAKLRIPELRLGPAPNTELANNARTFTFRNSGPITATMSKGVIRVESAHFTGRDSNIEVTGSVAVQPKNSVDLRVNGRVDLAILGDFSRDIEASGFVLADAQLRGPIAQPQVTGRLEMQKANFSMVDVPQGISNASGTILFSGTRATIQSLKGESGGGTINLSGFAGYEAGDLVFQLHAVANQVRVRYPEGVSTVADADLNLTGTSERSLLAGTVTVVRTGFNPQSDFSSILAKSAEPVRTPSARMGPLSGMHFDILVRTSPDVTFQSSLTQDLQVEGELHVRGTLSNPAVLGRINITQGELIFFGTRYTINEGSIAFYNPVRIEPILNVDLETKARGIDVTLTVSGPLNKLNLTPRSDPPLQFQEIVALLATGRTPTSDPTLLAREATAPQTWQQMGASALIGQAIANPVTGRLQRFFGVTKLKIDPSLTGVENNPQARLTIEQQVSRDITFTYITNVTSSNPMVVRVEWAFSRQWSVVALREENGMFGLDFFYKRRFR